jgi:hypothetical protein
MITMTFSFSNEQEASAFAAAVEARFHLDARVHLHGRPPLVRVHEIESKKAVVAVEEMATNSLWWKATRVRSRGTLNGGKNRSMNQEG